MEGSSIMESIKTLARKFIKLIFPPSHRAIDQLLRSEEPQAEEQTTTPSLDGLGLSPRVYNCLLKACIHNHETVASMPDEHLLNIHGFGTQALAELKERLASCNPSDDDARQTGNGEGK